MTRRIDFVAEVSSNHARDLERCLAFVRRAAEIGCTGVKFQLFKVRDLFAPEVLAASEAHRNREQWELPIEFIPEIGRMCRETDLEFLCTPFYLAAVDELLPFVDRYKIASYELLWEDLLTQCGSTGKPVVLSTGMATLQEVRRAVEVLRANGCRDLTLLHCVSGYPTPPEQCNLAAIETLRVETGCPTGWSDHSVEPAVIFRAVHRWGATFVEFHLDLDGQGDEFKTGHCWLPDQIAPVIAKVQAGFAADGSGEKAPVAAELADRAWRADPQDGLRPLKETRMGFHPAREGLG